MVIEVKTRNHQIGETLEGQQTKGPSGRSEFFGFERKFEDLEVFLVESKDAVLKNSELLNFFRELDSVLNERKDLGLERDKFRQSKGGGDV